MGRSRPIWALLTVTVALVLPIGGCLHHDAGVAAPAAAAPAASELSRFQTDNGLLYPPELWAAVGASEQARFLRWRMGRALDPRAADWSGDPVRTFRAIAAETDEATAAHLLLSAGITDRRFSDWCTGALARWAKDAVTSTDIDGLWMVTETANRLGCPLATLPSGGDALVATSAGSNDVIPAWEADSIVRHRSDPAATVPLPAGAHNLRGALDAARFLFLRAAQDGQHVASAPELARKLADSGVDSDDLARSYLVAAHVAAGDRDLAVTAADGFDRRRVLAGGDVLEIPRFDGSVGSTYRMLRRYAGRLDAVLAPSARERIRTALAAQRGQDPIFTVTADAALALLDGSPVAPADATREVAAALASMGVPDGPLPSAKASLAWTSIAECAASLGVPLHFPGVAGAAVREWSDVDTAKAGPTLARFLLAAQAAGATIGDPGVRALADRLKQYLAGTPLPELPTTSVVPGAVALHRLTGRWAVAPDALRGLLAERTGDCRGDFGGFLRDAPAPRSVCNVDSSLAGDQLAKDLTP
jgi:hypothetical protein